MFPARFPAGFPPGRAPMSAYSAGCVNFGHRHEEDNTRTIERKKPTMKKEMKSCWLHGKRLDGAVERVCLLAFSLNCSTSEFHYVAAKVVQSSSSRTARENQHNQTPIQSNCSETAVKLLGKCSGTAPNRLWNSWEIGVSTLQRTLLRNCSETAPKLLRNCSEITLK